MKEYRQHNDITLPFL